MILSGAWTGPSVLGLLLACAPAPARTAAPAPAPAVISASGAPVALTEDGPPLGAAAREPKFHCQVQLEIRDVDRVRGTGRSEKSPDEAHDLAWRRACDELHTRAGLDCEDDARVRVVKRSSSTSISSAESERTTQYEQTFELVGFRLAQGQGQADTSFSDACADAAEHACQAALGTPCPEGRVTVLHAEGDDPGASPPRPRGRPTI